MIAAVVLAAGGSSRLGRPKQLVRRGGQSLLRHAAAAALGGGCRSVVVVLGAGAERLRSELDGLDVDIVVNDSWRNGLAGSIRCGIEALLRVDDTNVRGVLLMGCDQPRISAGLVRRLVEAHRSCADRESGMVACAYGGTLGSPAVFGRGLFPLLLDLSGDRGAQALLLASPERVVSVAWSAGADDVDEPRDV